MAQPRYIHQYYQVLYADEISGIGTTINTLSVPVGHKGRYVEIINTGSTKIYFATDMDPAVGMQGVLPPNVMYYGEYDGFSQIRYKSSATGGNMSIIVRGV